MSGIAGGPIAVTASAGTNLNTSTLALEATQLNTTWLDLSAAGVAHLHFDATAKTASLTPGNYVICSDQGCHVRTGAQAGIVATLDDFYLPAGIPMGAIITVGNDAFAAIKHTDAGVLNMVKVS
jgi:hypothetical protein